MNPLALLASSRYSHAAGASGTVTVPVGTQVTSITAHVAAGDPDGTLTITPGGANQVATALDAIPLPNGEVYQFPAHVLGMGQLGGGTVLVFAGTDSYLVTYALLRTGGPA